MALTPKQEAFAQAIADGKTQADAYRSAYDVDPTCKPETIWSRASELMADGKVSGRVRELKDALTERMLWTKEQSVKVLAKLAETDETPAAAIVSAIKELNAMHGFNAPAKVDHTSSDGTMSPARATDDELHRIAKGG